MDFFFTTYIGGKQQLAQAIGRPLRCATGLQEVYVSY